MLTALYEAVSFKIGQVICVLVLDQVRHELVRASLSRPFLAYRK